MVSVSTVVFDGYAMDAAFAELAALGVTRVEPAFIKGYVAFDESAFSAVAAARMADVLARSGLTAQALSAHIDLGEADSADRLLHRMDFAAGIGAGIVITNATTRDRRAGLDATLARCLPRCAAMGLVLALENPGHGADALLPHGVAGAALVQEIAHPALRLNYDIGNAVTYGALAGPVLADLAAALPFAAHLHIKDVVERGADWEFCAIGQGMVGYAPLLDWLAGQPGTPPLGLELPLRLHRPGRADPERRSSPPSPEAIRHALRISLEVIGAAQPRADHTKAWRGSRSD
jgi:sugar phosphate isomerase/epimerase